MRIIGSVPQDLKAMVLMSEVKRIHDRVCLLEDRVDELAFKMGFYPDEDAVVRKDPENWNGSSFSGRKFSECPENYLKELLCEMIEYIRICKRSCGMQSKANKAIEKARIARRWMSFKKLNQLFVFSPQSDKKKIRRKRKAKS